jgi:hypothetical protein
VKKNRAFFEHFIPSDLTLSIKKKNQGTGVARLSAQMDLAQQQVSKTKNLSKFKKKEKICFTFRSHGLGAAAGVENKKFK